jgi:hypothetical protein
MGHSAVVGLDAADLAAGFSETSAVEGLGLVPFLYMAGSAGLAIVVREEKFRAGSLWGREVVIYFAVVKYFILRSQLFANANSLGAVMGIVAAPIILIAVALVTGLVHALLDRVPVETQTFEAFQQVTIAHEDILVSSGLGCICS